jgi:hypothetical protein
MSHYYPLGDEYLDTHGLLKKRWPNGLASASIDPISKSYAGPDAVKVNRLKTNRLNKSPVLEGFEKLRLQSTINMNCSHV